MRRYVSSVGLSISTTLLLLLGGEAGFRMAGYEPRGLGDSTQVSWVLADPVLGWVNRAGSFPGPDHILMTFLPDGRRFDPIGDKAADLPRILFVGDSFTQGYGVPDDEPYPHLVNGALAAAEVLNYGSGGYSTYQSLLRVRSYISANPAVRLPLVIYGFFGAHEARNVAAPEWIFGLSGSAGPYLVPPYARMEGNGLVQMAGGLIGLWPMETFSALVALAHHAQVQQAYSADRTDQTSVLKLLLAEMRDAVEHHASRLLVLGLSAVPPWLPAWAQQTGLDYADCRVPGYENGDPSFRVVGDAHPNGATHRKFADCVLAALAERGLSGY